MELIRRFFGTGAGELERPAQPRTTGFDQHEFAEAMPPSGEAALAAKSRRELVQRTLLETMASHGIPRDWFDCRTLSTPLKGGATGLHVQIQVRRGDQQILGYLHAFQDGFREELRRVDSHSPEWLQSVTWEFLGTPDAEAAKTADAFSDTQPSDSNPEELATDLAQLQQLMGNGQRP